VRRWPRNPELKCTIEEILEILAANPFHVDVNTVKGYIGTGDHGR
jgi:hypothetical protein